MTRAVIMAMTNSRERLVLPAMRVMESELLEEAQHGGEVAVGQRAA